MKSDHIKYISPAVNCGPAKIPGQVILSEAKDLILMLTLCMLLMPLTQTVKAGETAPVMVQNTIYIEQGEEYILKTDGLSAAGLVWSSSDTETATVTDGVIRANKAGYAHITVRDANDTSLSSNCLVVVKPKQVTGVQQIKAKSRKLTVAWKEIKNCGGYRVYYRKKGEKEYKQAKETTKTKAVLKNLTPETKYDIRISAFVDTPEGKTDGTASEKLKLYTAPEINSKTKITKVTKGRLSYYRGQRIRFYSVQWKKVKNANSYQVYTRYGNKKPQLITTVKKPQTTLYATLGYSYKIYVIPCRTRHGITTKGRQSEAVEISG